MHFVCPIPIVWGRVNHALHQAFRENEQITEKPPVALILGGWWASSDERKKECWMKMIDWAERYGYSHLIPDLKEDEQYWVHDMSRGYVDGPPYTIFEAAEYEDEGHLLKCIERGQVNDINDSRERAFERSALIIAAYWHWEEGVRLLLDNGADIERDGEGALHAAFHSREDNDWLPTVRLLIDRGVSMRSKDDDGWSLLFAAANEGAVDKVRFVLDFDSDLEQLDVSQSLIQAASMGSMDCCRLLLEAGADSTITNPEDGSNASVRASENGYTEVSEFIDKWQSAGIRGVVHGRKD